MHGILLLEPIQYGDLISLNRFKYSCLLAGFKREIEPIQKNCYGPVMAIVDNAGHPSANIAR